jgi:hypothetical protein
MLFSLILRPILIAWAIVVMLCAMAVSWSRQVEDQTMAAYWRDLGFDVCDLPCYAGIVPGETDFDDVTGLLAANLPALSNQLLVSNSQVGFTVEGDISADDRRVFLSGGIYYFQGNTRDIRGSVDFPLRWALLRFGAPDCATANPMINPQNDMQILYLYWQGNEGFYWVGVAVFGEHLTFEAQVFDIGASVNRDNLPVCKNPSPMTAWQGAAALWRYR